MKLLWRDQWPPKRGRRIFRIDPAGRVNSLFRFSGDTGVAPRANLIQASDGAFYGTTSSGGPSGGGAVYRLALPQIGIRSLDKLAGGVIRIHGAGVPLGLHTVRAAEDPSSEMMAIGTVAADEAGEITFDDAAAAGYAHRVYRIVYP